MDFHISTSATGSGCTSSASLALSVTVSVVFRSSTVVGRWLGAAVVAGTGGDRVVRCCTGPSLSLDSVVLRTSVILMNFSSWFIQSGKINERLYVSSLTP